MLRKNSLALNAMIVTLSLLLFSYTFVAKNHLEAHTRAFVTVKTLSYSKPLVELMRSGLDAALLQKLLSKTLRFDIQSEIAVYGSNQAEYIILLTSGQESYFGATKVASFKQRLHHHYQSTLEALVRDLRLFSASNLLAGGFAM